MELCSVCKCAICVADKPAPIADYRRKMQSPRVQMSTHRVKTLIMWWPLAPLRALVLPMPAAPAVYPLRHGCSFSCASRLMSSTKNFPLLRRYTSCIIPFLLRFVSADKSCSSIKVCSSLPSPPCCPPLPDVRSGLKKTSKYK